MQNSSSEETFIFLKMIVREYIPNVVKRLASGRFMLLRWKMNFHSRLGKWIWNILVHPPKRLEACHLLGWWRNFFRNFNLMKIEKCLCLLKMLYIYDTRCEISMHQGYRTKSLVLLRIDGDPDAILIGYFSHPRNHRPTLSSFHEVMVTAIRLQ